MPSAPTVIPVGTLKSAVSPGPSLNCDRHEKSVGPEPASVDRQPSVPILRTRRFRASVTYTLPLASTATPAGAFNGIPSLVPFAHPAAPGPPTRVTLDALPMSVGGARGGTTVGSRG